MIRILITGTKGYIGTRFVDYLKRESDSYAVHRLDAGDDAWRAHDFSPYQVVLHLAGMVHVKERSRNRESFFRINRDLSSDLARKAKADGVRHFIFMSTMSVYGMDTGVIGPSTKPTPVTAYGQSKYEAEELLRELAGDGFVLTILRPPLIYGKDCVGNYARLRKLALCFPLFPDINNQRSMLYIENLNAFLKYLIDEGKGGIFFPQNPEYVSTMDMVRLIAETRGKSIRVTKIFNPLLKIGRVKNLNKLFGNLVYERSLPPDSSLFAVCSFEESVRRSEDG